MPMAFMNRTNGNLISSRNGIKIQTVLMEDGSAAPKIIHYSEKEILTQLLWAIVAWHVRFQKDVTWECIKSSNKSKQKKCTVVIVR